MSVSKRLVPGYCLHRASGQAVVRVNGKDHYLGPHSSTESEERYRRIIAEYLTTGTVAAPSERVVGPTINELLAAFWTELEQTGRYTKNGRETSERGWIRDSVRPLCALYGSTLASVFGPRRLIELRTWMVENGGRGDQPLARSTVNGRIRRVVQVFRWGATMELVSAQVWQGLQAVRGLRHGESARVRETGRVRPVSSADVAAALPHLGSQVSAMVELQWLTGMRPAEVCGMRTGDLDRSGEVWVYRPEHHKTEHQGHSCERFLGPKAQELIRWFLKADVSAFLFTPEESERQRNLKRREARNSPRWPSHERRSDGVQASMFNECYPVRSYRRAIHRACKKAEIHPWSPNQLRHSRATEVRKRYGLEAAQVTLGHASADITQVYAERDSELARKVALETG